MNNLYQNIKLYSKNHPFAFVMIIAIITRLIAVFFAKGFGMHDDHFVYIETPQSWVDGLDTGRWFPWTPGNVGAQGHSMLYPGFNFLVLKFLSFIGIVSPDTKMYFIRFVHAIISLLIVSTGYKITKKLSDSTSAFTVGLMLAMLWVFPWLSVRSMVEIVSIPFLMFSIWSIVKKEAIDLEKSWLPFFISGLWSGIAFSVRFQVAFFILGLGLVILFQKGFLKAVWFTMGFLITVSITQGIIDFMIWKRPFVEFTEYVNYNLVHKGDYPNGPWYNYFLVIMGLIIPPISFLMLAGIVKSWKRLLIIFLPMFLFFAFHSYFPNKQERFILPILPFVIILGVIGWRELRGEGKFKWFSPKAERIVWKITFGINLILLLVISTMYSKKSRVESMLYLSNYQDVHSFLIENTVDNMTLWSPIFFTDQYPIEYSITQNNPIDSLLPPWNKADEPRFVFFFTLENLDNRVNHVKSVIPNLQYQTTIYPSFIDQLLSTINPVNKNYIVTIYKNNSFQLIHK
ncbi:MAG: glycosyltransferase family 39 protein [Bacteroidota bacterium]